MNVEMVIYTFFITTLCLNLQGLTCLFDYVFIQKNPHCYIPSLEDQQSTFNPPNLNTNQINLVQQNLVF